MATNRIAITITAEDRASKVLQAIVNDEPLDAPSFRQFAALYHAACFDVALLNIEHARRETKRAMYAEMGLWMCEYCEAPLSQRDEYCERCWSKRDQYER